ncbi:hypothetical protein FGSG_04150 [Fusarium graminearum PH-1]|uniref:Uncharacterized protein n=1 Tax=Gibberella zeae (strain ATCC MYA-4620 / CBS 123657 / FGSC 9075 / NRRL 31084 / PH-1) TaxID=229533 RepID=I1RJW7_GIBZE|nr:hypothetical protein FGSG_04150 [Fusarium graminearum PH-1]ESU08981.1 hypothetical protein FGSG_04150 [Fusarium graminearum PH-1]|eukprot:XP_011321480.1 hypothetical protein FGSG_04150 [Fusarium graminearum PH-1]
MASRSLIPSYSAHRAVCQAFTQAPRSSITAFRTTAAPALSPLQASPRNQRLFHAVSSRRKDQQPPAQPPPTNFSDLDVLGNTPAPSTSVDVCMYDGFGLNSGLTITGGNGVLLIDGEVFHWRPWEAKGSMNLINKKGQFELPPSAFALFDLLWPRPAPETRRAISELGMRIELLDTRNAAAQFNLLATERGVANVAAALIPIGWKDGVGAK